ncbi:MAG TPA: peptidylprolyl isomerase [Terriglobia bacterium]|nr:peptidylprolyl isomerase [Terriglobia bacterium]
MIRFFGPNRKKWVKWFLIAALAILSLGMVLTLAPLPSGDEGNITQANVLATVNGAQITVPALQQMVNNQLQSSGSNPGEVARIANTTLNQMVMQQAMLAQARKMGLEVSDQELLSALRQNPLFYQNGQFVDMQTYQDRVQQFTGMSVPQFEAQMRQSVLLQKLRDAVTDEVQVTPDEILQDFRQRNEKARINYVVLEPTQFFSAVRVTPQALNTYFLANRAKYKMSEQRQVKYILIPPDAVKSKIEISDAQLQNYYTQHLTDYQVPDEVKVSHILLKTTGESPQQEQQTLQLAQKVLAQVKAGGNFADLAKKYSQDPGSAQNGGELGWIKRGQTVKAFEDAAFSMKPGEISNLVKTEYGYHILKVEDKQTAHLQPFSEVKAAIEATLQKQMLQQAQNDLAAKIENEVKANPQDFDAVAKQNGLQSGETPLFAYDQPVPDLGNNEAFENLSFQLEPNSPGEPIQVPKGIAVIMVTKIVPEHLPVLSEVEQKVEQDYRAAQGQIMTAEKAKQFAAQASNGNFVKLAQTAGYKVQQSKDFTGQDQVQDGIPASSLASAFTLKPGQTSSAISIGSTYVVFQVVAHTPANEADFASQKATLTDQLLQQKRDLAFELYQNNLKQQMIRSGKLKYNPSAMKTFVSGYQTS